MQCAESLRLHAYFDAEVDPVGAAEIEHHLEHCSDCRALLLDLEQMRTELRRDLRYVHTPPPLRDTIMHALDQASRPPFRVARHHSFRAGALSGAAATALAAGLLFFIVAPRPASPLLEDLVNAHVRSLMPAHLLDVASTDKHTVKPWFAGHADVSPVVADFEPQGYRLIGGRADYLEHQRSAVVVYQHGAHVINVFSWAANGHTVPSNATQKGYHFQCWRAGDLDYCAVSDTVRDELLGLVHLLQNQGPRDGE